MAFGSSIKAFWSLNNSIEEEVSNNDFASLDIVANSYISFQRFDMFNNSMTTKYGLEYKPNHLGYVGGSVNLKSEGAFDYAISFLWYSPSVVGYTRHSVTRQKTSKITPIVAKADSTATTYFQNVNLGEFIISEVSTSSTQNAIKLQICSTGKHPTHEYLSESYTPGLHYIYIYVRATGQCSEVRFFIDGKAGASIEGPNLHLTPTTSAKIRLNNTYHGYPSHKHIQSGSFIADLMIQNDSTNAERDAIKSFRLGPEYVYDSSKETFNYDFWGSAYRQPSTTTTNQIYTVGGNIYLSRSNGDILKGSQPIWDNEFDYINDETVRLLTVINRENVSRDSRGLRINGTTVRI